MSAAFLRPGSHHPHFPVAYLFLPAYHLARAPGATDSSLIQYPAIVSDPRAAHPNNLPTNPGSPRSQQTRFRLKRFTLPIAEYHLPMRATVLLCAASVILLGISIHLAERFIMHL